MFYEIRQMEDPPVLIGVWLEGFRYLEHGKDYTRDIHARWSNITRPVFYILDMSHLDKVTFEGVLNSANSGVRGPNASLHHPMNRGTIFISSAAIIKATAKGMDSEAFGNVNILVVETLQQALDYVNRMIRQENARAG